MATERRNQNSHVVQSICTGNYTDIQQGSTHIVAFLPPLKVGFFSLVQEWTPKFVISHQGTCKLASKPVIVKRLNSKCYRKSLLLYVGIASLRFIYVSGCKSYWSFWDILHNMGYKCPNTIWRRFTWQLNRVYLIARHLNMLSVILILGGGFAETTFFLIVSSSIPWFLFFQPMVKWSNPLLMFGKKEKPKVRIECWAFLRISIQFLMKISLAYILLSRTFLFTA